MMCSSIGRFYCDLAIISVENPHVVGRILYDELNEVVKIKMKTNRSKFEASPLKSRVSSAVPITFVLMWSSGAIFVELGLQSTEPLTFLALRLLFSMAIMWLICLRIRPAFPRTISEWRNILITGLFLQAGYQIFFFDALAHQVSPGLLTIILGMQPILTALGGKERISGVQWAGLLFGMIGLILVVADSLFIVKISIIGMASAVLSMLSMTVGTFLQKHTTTSQPANMAIQYTGSAIILTIMAAGVEHFTVHWTISFVLALTWMVLIVSVGATMLLYFMIRQGALTNVTSVFYGVPPVTAILDYVIFGHMLHAVTILGMGMIIIGLISINRRETGKIAR